MRHRHAHHFRLFLVVSLSRGDSMGRHRKHYSELQPFEVIMSTPVTVSVGHNVQCSLVFLDQNSNPMLVQPTPDSPPTWSNSTPATETLSPGGLTASALALAAGGDTISVSVSVGGVTFGATLGVTVTPAPQILTSVDVAATVV
jgi:hypothetical protein